MKYKQLEPSDDTNNDIDISRLKEAYRFLSKIPASLIDMKRYRSTYYTRKFECNSVGCAMGHLTGMLNDEERLFVVSAEGYIDFDAVSRTLFNIDNTQTVWDFMFSGEWGDNKRTNTKAQILKRIKYVINHKTYPKIFKNHYSGFHYNFTL